MSHGFKVLLSGLIVIMFVLVACGSPAVPAAAPTQVAPAAPAGGATIANPASENCVKQGGKLTLEKRGDGGEFGVCWFEDALQCEEWALMRGECPAGGLKVTGYGPQGRYCAITGGQYTITGGDMTNEQGTCTLKNGKVCDGADYFNGKCDAASASAPAAPDGGSIANPASENCVKQGGKLTIEKRGDGGEFGVCWFEDALQCEEWALMRGECPAGGLKVTGYGPQGRYCAITGGQYTMTGGDMTNEKGTCTFKNGKVCDGADYFNGKCTP